MRKPIRIALMAGTTGVIAAGGASAAFAVQGNSQQTPKAASYSTSATVAPAPGQVSAQQARQIAQQRVPGARVTETDLEHEHGRAVWEVDLTKNNHEYEVRIDAATGTVLGVSAPQPAPRATVPAAPGTVSAQQARQIAQQRVPGARVTETERDHEHGLAVWEVDLTGQHQEWEVTIDAATGKVISVHYGSETEQDD